MDVNTLLLVCVLAWLGIGTLLTWAAEKSRQRKRLQAENDKLRRQLVETRKELEQAEETLCRRMQTSKLVGVTLRDAEIDRLLKEIGAWEKKYGVLEEAMRRMWPEEVKDGHSKETLPTGV